MVRFMRWIWLLMQGCNRVCHEVYGHNVDFVARTKGKSGQSRQENERPDHIELICFWATAVTQNDARTEYRTLHVRQKLPNHVFAEFFRACIWVVIRAVPVDCRIFLHHFVRPLSSDSNRAHMAETAQTMMIASP